MTPATLRATLVRLSLTQGAAARLLGVSPRTIRHWLSGDREMPEPAARLLDALGAIPDLRRYLDTRSSPDRPVASP
jgi:DNA-binding transcriptional regulator YiaG